MNNHLSVIGPGLWMDRRGRKFSKTASAHERIKNKYTEAEDRFVQRKLQTRSVEE